MNPVILKIMLGLGIIGHAINLYCDYILSVFPNGKLKFSNMKDLYDGRKMSQLTDGVSEKTPMRSSVLGAFALFLEAFGYFAITAQVYPNSRVLGLILFVAMLLFVVVGTAHHVVCGLSEWLYLKLGRTEEAHKTMLALYNGAPSTKACYLGYIAFVIALIVAIAIGCAGVSLWMIVFTVLPIFIVLAPLKIIGTLHISAMVSMLAWLIVV